MRAWNLYKTAILNSFSLNNKNAQKDLYYWGNFLFAMALVYILPLSLITLIPSLFVSISFGFHAIAIFDFIGIILMLIIAFSSWVNIFKKKIIFIILVYGLGTVLLTSLGSFGPGLIYLLTASVFMVIIFPSKYAFIPVFINAAYCIAYGLIIHYEWLEIYPLDINQTLSWGAISANLIFLSTVFSLLIPKMFDGLQSTIEEQINLKKSLEKSLRTLEVQNGELEQFAYVTSHDLQEPLRNITGFLTQLEKKYADKIDDKARNYIRHAVDGAKKMRHIILNLSDFTSIEYDFKNIELVDLNLFIKNIDSQNHSKISIKYDELPVIMTNAVQLNEIFKHLISNSIKFSKSNIKPEIRIQCKELINEWQFTLADNGTGMEYEGREKIFNIFQRLHSSKKYKGLGMGLAIVKKLVNQMNGRIWADATPGVGSTFHFTISKKNKL